MSLPRSVFLHVFVWSGQACRRGRGVFPVPAAAHPLRVIGLALFATLTLAGCDPEIREDANLGISDGQRLTQDQRDLLRAQLDGRVYREDKPFYGSAVEVKRGSRRGDPLPKALEGAKGLELNLKGQADVSTIAAAITAATDIQVIIRTRYILSTGDVVEVPIGTRMKAQHTGSLSAFLDQLAARMDVAWTYDDGVITIDRMTRRTWRVPLPLGKTEITENSTIAGTAVAKGGEGSGGDTGSNSNLKITTTRTLDPWKDLEDRIAPLAPSPANVTVSRATGRVEVFGPPSVQKTVGAVLEDVAATANIRIGLEVAVYFVDSNKADEFELALRLQTPRARLGAARRPGLLENALDTYYGDAGGFLILAKDDDAIGFEALARDNAVVDYRLASAVAQSGVITPIAITDRENYVRSKTVELAAAETVTPLIPPVNPPADPPVSPPATTQAASQRTSYKVETLQTGLSIAALPRLIDDRQIQLSLTFNYSDGVVVPLVSDIQTPKTKNREIRNQTVLAPGETLVLSGYEQDISRQNDSGVGVFRRIGLGGESKAQRIKVRMIIMVRPTLIPGRSPRQGGRS